SQLADQHIAHPNTSTTPQQRLPTVILRTHLRITAPKVLYADLGTSPNISGPFGAVWSPGWVRGSSGGFFRSGVAGEFSERYGDLVTGCYDCVDRIVLNAYFSVGHNPGGFRVWWRGLHGNDDLLDDTHLMRMAGRLARRVKAWGAANGVPVIF